MLFERDYFRPRQQQQQPQSCILPLIIANAMVFLLTAGGGDGWLTRIGALVPAPGYIWQLWRFFTYQFIHAGFFHLLTNMWALWFFGRMVEPRIGAARFLTMYFSSGVLGGLLYVLSNYGNFSVCVGASGAIFGVMVAAAITNPNVIISLLFPPIPLKLWQFVSGYCILELIFELNRSGGSVAHIAHLGGALGGFLFMRRLGFRPFNRLFRDGGNAFSAPPQSPRPAPPRNSETASFSQSDVNRILDKMARQGYEQLTEQEREILFRASGELKRQRGA